MEEDTHVYLRGHRANRPRLRKEWTREQCWLDGYLTALRAFRRDIRAGGERAERQKAKTEQRINWGKP